MISSVVSRASALFLLVGGVALLFGADVIMPAVIPTFPVASAWLGQLLAASWLALAALNWHHRSALLGGIYGRPVVFTNLILYFVMATSVAKPLLRAEVSTTLWIVAGPAAVFAVAYGLLLFRGPFDELHPKH